MNQIRLEWLKYPDGVISAVAAEHDPEKQEILRRIAAYWLGHAQGIWGD